MKIINLSVIVVLFSFMACTFKSGEQAKPRTPEETVKAFVELSASAKERADKKRLADLCQGELRRTFERMTDEGFQMLYLDSKLRIVELKMIESSAQGDSAKVHYSVSVENKQGTDPTNEVNEREVDLVHSQGNWYIESIP